MCRLYVLCANDDLQRQPQQHQTFVNLNKLTLQLEAFINYKPPGSGRTLTSCVLIMLITSRRLQPIRPYNLSRHSIQI